MHPRGSPIVPLIGHTPPGRPLLRQILIVGSALLAIACLSSVPALAAASAGGPAAVTQDALTAVVQVESPGAKPRLGSGFFVSPAGYLLTCAHVVEGRETATVRTADGRLFQAQIVARDDTSDLAILRVPVRNVPTLTIGDSSGLRAGDTVTAVGSPLGLQGSVTRGVVSSPARRVARRDFIQTDASVNPGMSGGPLLDEGGRAVGVISATVREAQGVGFAVPVNAAAPLLDRADVSVSVVTGNKALSYKNPPTRAGGPPRPRATPLRWWPWAGGGLLMSLLFAGLALRLRRRRRRRPDDVVVRLRAPNAAPRPQASTPVDTSDIDIELK